jgi:hypothetical protein
MATVKHHSWPKPKTKLGIQIIKELAGTSWCEVLLCQHKEHDEGAESCAADPDPSRLLLSLTDGPRGIPFRRKGEHRDKSALLEKRMLSLADACRET